MGNVCLKFMTVLHEARPAETDADQTNVERDLIRSRESRHNHEVV